jgi:hypothetical protein
MCEPTTIMLTLGGLAIATGVAGTITSAVGQANAAAAQNNYQAALARQRNQQITENNRLASEAYNRQAAQENLKFQQQRDAAAQNLQKNQVLALQARARTRVAAGEAGVSGIAVDQLMGDFYRQEALFRDATAQNLEYGDIQRGFNLEGYKAEAEGRVNSIQPHLPTKTEGPSFIGTALQVGKDVFGGAASLYGSWYQMKHPQGAT